MQRDAKGGLGLGGEVFVRYQFYAFLEKALILFQRVAFLYVWLFLFWGFCLFVFGILFLLSCFFKYISKSYRNLYKISTYGEVSFIKQTYPHRV